MGDAHLTFSIISQSGKIVNILFSKNEEQIPPKLELFLRGAPHVSRLHLEWRILIGKVGSADFVSHDFVFALVGFVFVSPGFGFSSRLNKKSEAYKTILAVFANNSLHII